MILVTADLHLNHNRRDEYRHVFMRDTLPGLLRKHRVRHLAILGDLTTEKDRHGAWLVNTLIEHLWTLSKICPVIINRGNHDYTDPENPFFSFVSTLDNVTWINTPTVWETMLFLPHTSNWKRDWSDLDFTGYSRIFAHQTFQGAKVGPRTLEGVPLDQFPPGAQIVSGDVHEPQTFDWVPTHHTPTSPATSVTYVGAPYLCNFGDHYIPRVLLIDDETVKSVPVSGTQKRLLEVEWGSSAAATLDNLDKGASAFNAGDMIKVRVALQSGDHAHWPEIQKQVRAWGEQNAFQIYVVQPELIGGKGAATARRRVDAPTDQELMKRYGKARAIIKATLDVGFHFMQDREHIR